MAFLKCRSQSAVLYVESTTNTKTLDMPQDWTLTSPKHIWIDEKITIVASLSTTCVVQIHHLKTLISPLLATMRLMIHSSYPRLQHWFHRGNHRNHQKNHIPDENHLILVKQLFGLNPKQLRYKTARKKWVSSSGEEQEMRQAAVGIDPCFVIA